MHYKVFLIYLIIFPKEQNLLSFAAKTNKEMSDLGITSLSISNSKAVLENDDVEFSESFLEKMILMKLIIMLNIQDHYRQLQ